MIILISISCSRQAAFNIPSFTNTQDQIKIDGQLNEAHWLKAYTHDHFVNVENSEKEDQMVLKITQDESYIYFGISLQEHSFIFRPHDEITESIALSDRVEIFFATDSLLNEYYGIELDLWGRYFDFKAKHYRQIDTNWSWPNSGLVLSTTQNGHHYQAEFRFSKASLIALDLLKDDQSILMGFFRADFYHPDHKGSVHWISWKPAQTDQADFHIPEVFSKFNLADQ